MADYVLEFITQSPVIELSSAPGPQGATGAIGPQGPQGIQGVQGPKGDTGVYVGPNDPGMTSAGLWVQTFSNGDYTIWIEDGN